MNNLYVIEGTSNSGKTTTSNFLKEFKNVEIIPEFMVHPLSPKPSKSLEEELKNQQIFYEIEKDRMQQASLLLSKNKIVFMERSFVSVLAVSYAFKKLGKYDAFSNCIELYNKMLKEHWYINPDIFYVLIASSKEKIIRNNYRNKILKDSWINSDFDFYQNEFYDTMMIDLDRKFIETDGQEKKYASEYISKNLKLRR